MAETQKTKAPKGRRRARREGREGQGTASEKARPRARWTTAPKVADGTPRLQAFYEKTVRARLAKQFGLTNPHQVPRLEKIVLNVGHGRSEQEPEAARRGGRGAGADHRPEAGGDPGQEVDRELRAARGHAGRRAVTLRGARMYEFLDRFITHRGAADPRLPRAAEPELRRPGQLHVRHQGADDLPRDRLRQGREDPRDGHHDRDDGRARRPGAWRCCASWAGRSGARRRSDAA